MPELRPGERQDATASVLAMGGKGCNVSLVLRALGERTVATGLVGGEAGRRVDRMLRAAGVETDFVQSKGETRTNLVLIETSTHRHSTLCAAGLRPGAGALAALKQRMADHLAPARAVAVCGSMPPGWLPEHTADLVAAAGPEQRPVIVDAAGEALLAGIEAGATAVKPNRAELEGVAGRPLATLPEAAAAARTLLRGRLRLVVASLGPEGALAVSPEGAWHAPAPRVHVVSPAGAGDGMMALICLGLCQGRSPAEILRHAVAAGSAIATTEATADLPLSLYNRLVGEVMVEPIREE